MRPARGRRAPLAMPCLTSPPGFGCLDFARCHSQLREWRAALKMRFLGHSLPMMVTPRASRLLPTGTVTFLFTDVEGSTRLWETQREAMAEALTRHAALLRQCIEVWGGHIFKTGGDAFYATFPTAASAVEAALAAQRALRAERWPE